MKDEKNQKKEIKKDSRISFYDVTLEAIHLGLMAKSS